jgi:hypothetical protein
MPPSASAAAFAHFRDRNFDFPFRRTALYSLQMNGQQVIKIFSRKFFWLSQCRINIAA